MGTRTLRDIRWLSVSVIVSMLDTNNFYSFLAFAVSHREVLLQAGTKATEQYCALLTLKSDSSFNISYCLGGFTCMWLACGLYISSG